MAVPPRLRKRPDKRKSAKPSGKKPPLPKKGMTDRLLDTKERDEIRERYAKGDSISTLAREYNLTDRSILQMCRDLVDARVASKKEQVAQRNAEIQKRFAEGETKKELARCYNLSRSAVDYICR
jgi:Mor family transcriptional regulator